MSLGFNEGSRNGRHVMSKSSLLSASAGVISMADRGDPAQAHVLDNGAGKI